MNQLPLVNYLVLFVISALFVGFLTPKLRNFALSEEIFDSPTSAHKVQLEPVPYLGGIAIALGVVATTVIAAIFIDSSLIRSATEILLPPLFLAAVGLIDDLINLEPLPRFIAQTLVGITVSLILVQSDTVGAPTGSRNWDIAITVVFIVTLSNSINFFDNVDGGASGTVAISTFFLRILAYFSGQYYIAGLSIVMSGATIGFLWWNKSPAKIYMGDAGSLFLGSLLASILVRFDPNPIHFPTFFFVPLFLVAVPLLDTCTVIISRISRKLSPFKGGLDHLSHRLIRLGIPKASAVTILWGMTTIYGLFAITLSSVPFNTEPIVSSLGLILWIALLIFFLRLPASELESKEK